MLIANQAKLRLTQGLLYHTACYGCAFFMFLKEYIVYKNTSSKYEEFSSYSFLLNVLPNAYSGLGMLAGIVNVFFSFQDVVGVLLVYAFSQEYF